MTQSILKGVGCVIGGIVLCGLLLGGCLGFGWVIGESNIPGEFAEIEAVRRDAAVVDPQQAEDVIGQVTSWNRKIASNQAMNQTWWAGWAISDKWMDVELIAVPTP